LNSSVAVAQLQLRNSAEAAANKRHTVTVIDQVTAFALAQKRPL
jgi:hypothetical protein